MWIQTVTQTIAARISVQLLQQSSEQDHDDDDDDKPHTGLLSNAAWINPF